MRASLLGGLLALLAVPAVAAEDRQSSRGLACAAPTLFQCAIIVPGFTRWFLAPFGIAPSDAEMAARVCGEKQLPVAAMIRKPTGSGPLSQTTALEITCGQPRMAARPSPTARPPIRDAEGERFAPLQGREVEAEPRPRSGRRAREAREAREASREIAEPARRAKRRSDPAARESAAGPASPGKPPAAAEPKRDAPEPAASEVEPKPVPVDVRSSPAPEPAPAEAPPPPPTPARPEARDPAPAAPFADPSIIYDHL